MKHHILREYPRGFGECLLPLLDDVRGKPRLDLRQKWAVNPALTDLDIFSSLETGDVWVDAKLPSVFMYLYKRAAIPDAWHNVMESFRVEMEKFATGLLTNSF